MIAAVHSAPSVSVLFQSFVLLHVICAIGGFGANHHLRQSLVFLNVPAMQQPEAYLGGADKLFDASGKLINEGTRKFLQGFMQSFDAWIGTIAKA